MSYNIWGGGANEGKTIDETLAVIRAANPDVIGLQEVRTEGEVCEADYCPPGPDSVGTGTGRGAGLALPRTDRRERALWAKASCRGSPITDVDGCER